MKAIVVPVGVALIVGLIIVSIGEGLLAAAHVEHSYALYFGLTVTLTICAASYFLAGGLGIESESHH